jgi:hypothetical protein
VLLKTALSVWSFTDQLYSRIDGGGLYIRQYYYISSSAPIPRAPFEPAGERLNQIFVRLATIYYQDSGGIVWAMYHIAVPSCICTGNMQRARNGSYNPPLILSQRLPCLKYIPFTPHQKLPVNWLMRDTAVSDGL